MEITKREVIASITIIAVWLMFGFFIAGKINTWQQDQNAEYDRAIKIDQQELFEHGMKTNVGNAFVYGTLEAKEPVICPEIKGEYISVLKVKEKYTMHTRVVTYTTGTKRWLGIYFQGIRPNYALPLHIIGTAFQKEVWEILCTIPYGKTMTYGEIAKIIADWRGSIQMIRILPCSLYRIVFIAG